jgi:hypothetical protein
VNKIAIRVDAGQSSQAAPQTHAPALGVDQLMEEPEKHPGALVVEGVVKTASKKDRTVDPLCWLST